MILKNFHFRDFLKGMSRIFDLFGYFEEKPVLVLYSPYQEGRLQDGKAIGSDWMSVGNDIAGSMQKFKV